MADKAKLCSPIRSTFEALVVQCVVGYCGEDHHQINGPLTGPKHGQLAFRHSQSECGSSPDIAVFCVQVEAI